MIATRSKRSRETIATTTTTTTTNRSSIRRLQLLVEERGNAEPILKHSQSNRNRKRIELLQHRENRRIHRVVAAIEEQLASYEQQNTTQHYHRSSFFQPDDSISTSSSNDDDDLNNSTNNCNDESFSSVSVCDEQELVALSRSLQLEESPSSSGRKLLQQGHRRRGGISVVMTPRR
jgi:hypothetical protein